MPLSGWVQRQLRWLARVLAASAWEWHEDKVPRMAAALAFYTLFSLTPIILIMVAVSSWAFGREAAVAELYHQAELLIGPDGIAALRMLVENAPTRTTTTIAALVGAATMIFAATSAFAELKDSLNTIWEVQPSPGLGLWEMCRDRFLSFALVLVIGFFLLVSLMLSATLAHLAALVGPRGLDTGTLLPIAHQVFSYGLFTLLFALIYKVLPDACVRWRQVWLGAATTTGLFVVGKWAFGVYLGHTTIGAGFGAAGSLVIVILWTYYSTLILLLGAEITQVQSRLAGDQIVPAPGAVHVTEHDRVQEGRPHADTIAECARNAADLA